MARIETRITRRIIAAAILTLCLSGCRDYDSVQERKFSDDGEFWAEHGTQLTSALEYDIKGITIGKTHPSRIDAMLGKKSEQICTLQGHGHLTTTWIDAKHLEVACEQCDSGGFLPSSNKWEGISIRFIYNGKLVSDNIF
jgi:hypothetical protein